MTLSEIDGRNALARLEVGERPASRRLPNHTISELLIPLSSAVDLAEGREVGHAQRVAFIAGWIATEMSLDVPERLSVYYAALFHDVGVIQAGARLATNIRGDERLLFSSLPLLTPEEASLGSGDSTEEVIEQLVAHSFDGARFAAELGLPEDAAAGIASHHENWDGSGYPNALRGQEIPVAGRIVGLADQIESMIGQASALQARRNLTQWLWPMTGGIADPEVVSALRDLSARDEFWLGLYSTNLQAELTLTCARLRETKAPRLQAIAEAFAQRVDARFPFTAGISNKVSSVAESLGRAAGLPEQRVKLLRIAALLHDIGQLSVSERIMAKPGILSVDELDVLQLHPLYSSDIAAAIPGLEEVALWIGTHHERLDGKGYPEQLNGADIPLEARILAIADTYVAMTSDRPHRPRMEPSEALRRLRTASSAQLDGALVDLFISSVAI